MLRMLKTTLLALLFLQSSTNWTTYSGDYNGQRHSPLKQITPANAGQLRPVWTFQTGVLGKWEATPPVVDGGVDAARGGRVLWRYRRELPPSGMNVCCGNVNRGLAVYKDKLMMVTLDAHLVALD